jgi:PAS domain S-box-containing protein
VPNDVGVNRESGQDGGRMSLHASRTESSPTAVVLSKLGFKAPSELREQLIVAFVLVLFASVFVARLVLDTADQPAALLYALPIALVAAEYGARAGMLTAGVAIALFAIYTDIESATITPLAWTTHVLVFVLLGGLLGNLSDRLRTAHRTVTASVTQLQAILDNATAVIYLKDLDGRYLLLNRHYEKLFDVRKEEAVGKTDHDLFPQYAADSFRAADRKVLKAGRSLEIEEVIPHRDGPHTYISIKFPLYDADGEPYGICSISTDITERMRAEQQIRESKEQFRRIIDTAQEAFISIDARSVITGWNQQAETTFGWSRAQAIGQPIVDLIVPDRFRAHHYEGIKRFLETGSGPVLRRRMELVAKHRDRHEFPIEIAVSAMRTKNGYTFNAFLHDISERKRGEELARIKAGLERQTAELRRSNLELAQFAHAASHDLSEPLRTVSRYVQLLDSRYRAKLDDDAHEFIGYAVEGAARMQALVNALNAYSTFGSAEHEPVPVDCSQVVSQTVDVLAAQIADVNAEVTVDPLPTIKGDPRLLAEVFQNLISNALKFVKDKPPRVHVSAERTDDSWCFTVADNGIGIKPEHRNRIFEMFRRLHNRDQYGGTGIGLTICRKIVTRHGGRIWVEEAENGGSSFRFTIPDESAVQQQREPEPLAVPKRDGAPAA